MRAICDAADVDREGSVTKIELLAKSRSDTELQEILKASGRSFEDIHGQLQIALRPAVAAGHRLSPQTVYSQGTLEGT